MTHKRPFWLSKIEQGWKRRPIVWLSGARRTGKTTLARMIEGAVYLNCDLPSVVRRLADPESFFDSLRPGSTVVLDEIHRLNDPSAVLKIAADAYPHLKVLATGSSTLAATRKFRDSLAGRKHTIYLSPVLWSEARADFGLRDLDRRLLHGGLPEPLLSATKDPAFFAEWIDSYYARDIQELFAIRSRTGFMQLLSLVMRQSGGLLDETNLARLSGLSRPTVKAHLEAMSIAHAVHLLPPFHGGGTREITHRPKCYAFDTGFVTFVKGWDTIRDEDRGLLWEHLVLDFLRSETQSRPVHYWRDKSGREIDFVIKSRGQSCLAIECKINPDHFRPDSLFAFRDLYPEGRNLVVCPGVSTTFDRRFDGLKVTFGGLESCLMQS